MKLPIKKVSRKTFIERSYIFVLNDSTAREVTWTVGKRVGAVANFRFRLSRSIPQALAKTSDELPMLDWQVVCQEAAAAEIRTYRGKHIALVVAGSSKLSPADRYAGRRMVVIRGQCLLKILAQRQVYLIQ